MQFKTCHQRQCELSSSYASMRQSQAHHITRLHRVACTQARGPTFQQYVLLTLFFEVWLSPQSSWAPSPVTVTLCLQALSESLSSPLNLWAPVGRRVAPTGPGLFLQVIYVTIFHAFNKTQLKINQSSMAIWSGNCFFSWLCGHRLKAHPVPKLII